jgi:hypothetical protein
MNITSPSCVNEIMDYVDGIVHTPSPSADESDTESLHHQLVERWFRDRFFLPRPYRSTSISDFEDNKSYNTIVDDGSYGRSMMLFSDNLVSREIRSNIVSISDDDESCNLRYRCANPLGFAHSELSRSGDQRRPPLGVVTVVENGAPLMPLCRNQDTDERLEAESEDGDDDEGLYDCKPDMGFIQRTFSFDDHLPIIHRRGASIRQLNTCLEDDNDCYIDEQPSFTMPITYSNDSDRSKVLYPVSISGSL